MPVDGVLGDPPSGSQGELHTTLPHSLNFTDYAIQYERYKRGEISGAFVAALWGEQTWDLMQAQEEVERLEAATVDGGINDVDDQGDDDRVRNNGVVNVNASANTLSESSGAAVIEGFGALSNLEGEIELSKGSVQREHSENRDD